MFNECHHIQPSGDRCHAAALRNQPYCYFHNKLHYVSRPSAKTKALTPIEDDRSLKLALAQILRALTSPSIDVRRARLMLYGLQIAAQVMARSTHPTPYSTARSVFTQPDGSEPAPRQIASKPPAQAVRKKTKNDRTTGNSAITRKIRKQAGPNRPAAPVEARGSALSVTAACQTNSQTRAAR